MARQELSFWEVANFHPKQYEAAQAVKDFSYILYGGAAGGGKSYWIRWTAVLRLLEFAQRGISNVRVGIFCESYVALDDRHLAKIPFEFPKWLGEYSLTRREFTLSPEYGSGVLAFRNLDDPSKYLSSEFADIWIDELTMNKREIFDFIITRLRWPGITDNKFCAASNPGQIGHGWVKKLWIDRNFENEKLPKGQFHYIKALYTDNPHIDAVSYGARLSSMPEGLRRAYMEGDWSIFAGQFFTEFKKEQHVIEPWGDEATWKWFNALPTYCGLDWGYNDPSAVVWAKFHDNTWYIYKELYINGLDYEELKQRIINIEVPRVIYADPSIWAKKDSPNSGAHRMYPLPLKPAVNDRVIGWTLMKQAMKQNRIKIFSNCENLIRTIPDMVYNESAESKKEDMATKGVDDHICDATRYLIASFLHTVKGNIPLTYSGSSNMGQRQEKDLDELFQKKKKFSWIPRYKK